MAIAGYYIFDPCCPGGHPAYFKMPPVSLPSLPYVYNYSGPTILDNSGIPLVTGSCYLVTGASSGDLGWVNAMADCPVPDPITFLPFTGISPLCPTVPNAICPCTIAQNPVYNVYSLQPCCGGLPTTVYLIDNALVDSATYVYITPVPDGDLVPLTCYTVTEIPYTGVGVPPFVQVIISEFALVEEGCNSFCSLICLDCICTRFLWTGTIAPGTFSITYKDCNFIDQILLIQTDGVTWSDKVCLKQIPICSTPNLCWITESFGDCLVDDTDTSNILYNCSNCYELVDCRGIEDNIYTFNPQVEQYINTQQVIQIVGSDTCWQVNNTDNDCECAIAVTVQNVFVDCPSCINPKGFKLTECTTGEVQYTTTDLSDYTTVIINTNCPGCWLVEPIDIVPPSTQPVTVTASFGDCVLCNSIFYELTDCTDILDPIITVMDLSEYVGQVITIDFCPNTCWEVSVTDPNTISGDVSVNLVFADCPDCAIAINTPQCVNFINETDGPLGLPYINLDGEPNKSFIGAGQATGKICVLAWPVSALTVIQYGDCVNGECPKIPQTRRKVKPGYDTAACTPAYYEKIECNFSEWMYKDVLTQRYGISSCCDDELMKWEIKHELLMLAVLVNPDYTCAPPANCGCTVSSNCGFISSDIVHATCPTPSPPPPPLVSYNCVETPTCVEYQCLIQAVGGFQGGGTLFYKNCEGIEEQQSWPQGKFSISIVICSIPNATSNDIYAIGSPFIFTFSQTPIICESTFDCVEVQGTRGSYPTLLECETNCVAPPSPWKSEACVFGFMDSLNWAFDAEFAGEEPHTITSLVINGIEYITPGNEYSYGFNPYIIIPANNNQFGQTYTNQVDGMNALFLSLGLQELVKAQVVTNDIWAVTVVEFGFSANGGYYLILANTVNTISFIIDDNTGFVKTHSWINGVASVVIDTEGFEQIHAINYEWATCVNINDEPFIVTDGVVIEPPF